MGDSRAMRGFAHAPSSATLRTRPAGVPSYPYRINTKQARKTRIDFVYSQINKYNKTKELCRKIVSKFVVIKSLNTQ